MFIWNFLCFSLCPLPLGNSYEAAKSPSFVILRHSEQSIVFSQASRSLLRLSSPAQRMKSSPSPLPAEWDGTTSRLTLLEFVTLSSGSHRGSQLWRGDRSQPFLARCSQSPRFLLPRNI